MTVNQGKLILMLGGARSGKSRLAEEMALETGGTVAYIATAAVLDKEMARRVDLHQQRRPDHWVTVEETRDLAGALERVPSQTRTVIVDCLTLWLTNLLLPCYDEQAGVAGLDALEEEIRSELERFCRAAKAKQHNTIVVANEVGCGIVPESPLGRLFRDLAGRANQLAATEADAVYFAVAGYPLRVKGDA